MKFYIREWSAGTIVLMTENSNVLAYFESVSEALEACSEWYSNHQEEQKYEVSVQYNGSKMNDWDMALVG